MIRAMTPLNVQSATDTAHNSAPAAAVKLTSKAMMSSGARIGERGRRMVLVSPLPLPGLSILVGSVSRQRVPNDLCDKPSAMRGQVSSLPFRSLTTPLQGRKKGSLIAI